MNGVSGIGGMGGIGVARGFGASKPLGGMKPMNDMEQAAQDEEALFRLWAARVGELRASAAKAVYDTVQGKGGPASKTLPELLTEAHLRGRGARYEAQVVLMIARPDFVVFDTPKGGAVIWRVQGDYWHGSANAQAKDAAQRAQLEKTTVRGLPVTAVVDLWESDIYERPDAVFEAAWRGEGLRGA